MARSRRTAAKTPTGTADQSSGGELTCPECGKTFTRAASLGAHRQRAHGVSGARKRTSGRRTSTTRGRSQRARRNGRATAAARTRPATSDGVVNRDQLLQALFPHGVPPREDVIKRVSNWLDEAERLATL